MSVLEPSPNDALAIEDTSLTGPDIEQDAGLIAEQIFTALQARAPGWTPHDGNLETWLVEAFATVASQVRSEAASVPAQIFATYATEVLGIPRRPSSPARGRSAWTAVNDAGYTIPAGTELTLPISGSERVAFRTTDIAEIPIGETTLEDVQIEASENGAGGNGLAGAGDPVDPLAWVESIRVDELTFGGDDGQSQAEYLDGLSQLFRLVALRPVLPGDFGALARRIPGVGRAIVLDTYNPANQSWGNARMVTVALTNPAGDPVTQGVKDEVRDYLTSLREATFQVHVMDCDYQNIGIVFRVVTFAEQNPIIVRDACEQAVRREYSPATYRLGVTSPGIGGGEVIPLPWTTHPTRQMLRQWDLVALFDRVRGVDYVAEALVNGVPYTVMLANPFTLPRVTYVQGQAVTP